MRKCIYCLDEIVKSEKGVNKENLYQRVNKPQDPSAVLRPRTVNTDSTPKKKDEIQITTLVPPNSSNYRLVQACCGAIQQLKAKIDPEGFNRLMNTTHTKIEGIQKDMIWRWLSREFASVK